MNEQNEVKKLKVGDVVYRSVYNSLSKEIIVAVTKTTATTDGGTKLRTDLRANNYIDVIGKDRWASYSYHIESASLNEKYQRQRLTTLLKRKLESIKISELSTERIQEIIDFLQ